VAKRDVDSAKCWSEWQDLNLRPPRPERGALPDRGRHRFFSVELPWPLAAPWSWRLASRARSAGHSEIAAKLLTDLGANFHVFSEQALILQGNLSDFDSAIQAAGQPPCARRNDDRTRLGRRVVAIAVRGVSGRRRWSKLREWLRGGIKGKRPKDAICSPRSMAGSLKASTRESCKTPRRCSTSWRKLICG
jgi:hypothetical protein